jgi:hypothetical protein
MELCKAQVEVEEYVIHVAEVTDLCTYLRFSLLASTWLPRPVGACLWSLLHIILVLYSSLMLLSLFVLLLVLAVLGDALMLITAAYIVLLYPVMLLGVFLGIVIALILTGIYLVLTCCCWASVPMPYLLREPEPQEGAAAAKFPGPLDMAPPFPNFTGKLFKYVAGVSFPIWRVRLESLCREIVPLYPAIVI